MPRRYLPCLLALTALITLAAVPTAEAQGNMNLLLNSSFDFHCFDNSRSAVARCYQAGYVACWNSDAYSDVVVTTAPHVEGLKLQAFARNVVAIKPGKRLYQVVFLPEVGLRHGDAVSLLAYGAQKAPDSLRASVHVLKIDSQTGTWKPSDFGCSDSREFPKHSRGDLVRAKSFTALSGAQNDFQVKLEKCDIPGSFIHKNESSDSQVNSIALLVEFHNAGKDGDVLVYAPCLVKGETAQAGLPELRQRPTAYRGLPRTIRKLWRGEPLHILVMGSSIDRGSANPPLYPYDENPQSEKFKQPLSDQPFNGELIGRADLTGTVGQWRHYYAWAGQLRTELLRKFNYPPERLLLHYMACDGSCISEATSGLAEYASLSLPPSPEVNGQPSGRTWQEMYPALFERPGGPGPDLILFGSGANEKTDQPDEGAIFEGTIRWMQRHYPDCEFAFAMWQNLRGYTPNTGHLMELSLAYGIPFLDLGDRIDQLMNYANRYALCPSDGHPQAAGHWIWFKSLEEAFEVADPISFGTAQAYRPRRLYPTSYGWEGEITTYAGDSPRIVNKTMLMLDDTTINAWGKVTEGGKTQALVDGVKIRDPRTSPRRDIRNSMVAYGKLSLGDRHVFELAGEPGEIAAADCKTCPNRQWLGVGNPRWSLGQAKVEAFASTCGAPCGDKQVRLQPGQAIELEAVGTDLSVAWVDAATAGTLKVTIDGRPAVELKANVPFKDSKGTDLYFENRRGFRDLGYGLHHVRIEAAEAPVAVLGLFSYDSRSNRDGERQLVGNALPGEVVALTPAFRARPVVTCSGALAAAPADITSTHVKFSGTGAGSYQIVGE